MKFDAIVINPPYATTGGATLHLDFTEAALKLSDKVVSIFPFGFIYSDTKAYQKYKEDFNNRLISVEEKSSTAFADTNMRNVGIYDFEKSNRGEIKITDINGKSKKVNSLIGTNSIKEEEQEIFEYLSNVESIPVYAGGSKDYRSIIKKYPTLSQNELKTLASIKSCEKIKKYYENNPNTYGLIISDANGAMNGKTLTSKIGQIFSNYNDIEQFFISVKPGYNVMLFKTLKSAENYKKLASSSLIRFIIYRTQIDQHLTVKVYKYIPNIDWSKVKNDVDILLQCGCPKDKAEEFVRYADDIIYRVDHGERP